jgi:Zn2+/Cd2+-exporting ATPase
MKAVPYLHQEDEQESCVAVIHDIVADEPGIVQVSMDTAEDTVVFGYQPDKISADSVEQVAQKVTPILQQRWETCTMRLGRRGGRACESCSMALERELRGAPGVRRATASYVGGVLSVTYDQAVTSPDEISRRVQQLGVRVEPSGSEGATEPVRRPFPWLTAQRLEAIFTAVTLIAMLGGLLAERMDATPPIATTFYLIAYVTGGVFGLKGGLESLRNRTIDVDLLMILAAIGAAVVGQPFEGAMLLFLFSLSNVLQDFALDRTRNAIKALMKLRPDQALVRRGEQTVMLPVERIIIGDHMIVKPGDRIALDGMVSAGESSVDQSSITGESIPVSKTPGSKVFGGTINKNGSLDIVVTKLAKDSTLARLIRLVEEAHSEKAETQRFIDKAEQYYAMGVIALTALAAVLPLLWAEPFATAFYRAMTIMVAASPCAIVISTPATVLSAIGNGARRGVLFKGGIHVENAATVKVVAFDKTGTLTAGKPQVTDVVLFNRDLGNGRPQNEDELLALAAAAETRSEHPLAQATVTAANQRNLDLSEAFAFQATTGKGVEAQVDGRHVRIGNLRYFEEFHTIGLAAAEREVTRLQNEGKTSVVVAYMEDDGRTAHLIGAIAFADVVRPDAADVVRQIRAAGVERVVMLTGDNEQVAMRIAAETGVDEVFAGLLPEDKVAVIKRVREQYGPVAMVGDGVNDAPALATATIGIAMGAAGTDVALETADIVLMADDLKNIPYVIGLSRQTRKTLAVNLGFALFMILLMLITIFVADLPLPAAVVGHEGGTVLVSLNGLRLLGYRPKLAV